MIATCVAAAALLVLHPPAHAAAPPRVVLIGPSESDPVVARLRQELTLLGLDVELLPAAREEGALADVVRTHDAIAAIVVEEPDVVLWIDPTHGQGTPAAEEIRLHEGTEPRMLALRAVELLRERLPLPGAPAPAPPAPPAPPPAPLPVEQREPPRTVVRRAPSAFVGPALLTSPGGLGPMAHVWLGARFAPVSRLELELVGAIPVTASSVSAPEGSMSLRTGAVGAGVGIRLTDAASSAFANVGAGLGAMIFSFEGQANTPWQAASGLRASMFPYARLAAGYWITPRLALRADATAGFALPEPLLWIAGRRVAIFGEPAMLFAVGLEVRL